jgi:hypothetical protein
MKLSTRSGLQTIAHTFSIGAEATVCALPLIRSRAGAVLGGIEARTRSQGAVRERPEALFAVLRTLDVIERDVIAAT